jgi:hypothetical protein
MVVREVEVWVSGIVYILLKTTFNIFLSSTHHQF